VFDIHSHILFGVDDGASTFAESQAMLNAAQDAGIDQIVCTPHFRGSRFDLLRVKENYQVLSAFAQKQGFQMALGYEVYWENLADIGFDRAPDFCIANTNLLLLEFSYGSLPPNWQRIIFDLQGFGVQPIIAHPERYRPIQDNLDIAVEMKSMGCLLQLSGNVANNGILSASRRTAIKMLEDGLIDYIASDAHAVADYSGYKKTLELARKH
jgi:protein-tyrosine phosphatase